MTQNSTSFASAQATRRRLLKVLAGAPMLPLGGTLAAAASLAACGGDGRDGNDAVTPPTVAPAVTFASASFVGMAAPSLTNPAAMATTTVDSQLKVSFSDGSSETFDLAYQPFFKTGDMVPDGKGGTILAGGYYDIANKALIDTSVAASPRQFFSDCPDGTSLIHLEGAKVDGVAHPVFCVVQFEYASLAQDGVTSMYGRLPSPIAVLTLDQDPATGALTLKKYHNVDMSSAHGLWITCGASLSPWNTHLSSEEYEPDAFTAATSSQFRGYSKNVFGNETTANPYHYGHLPEITVNQDGTGSVTKHYCLGRISHELVQVMPDERTVIMGDDYTNGGFFMFVADKARDLSAGTLYVARYDAVLTDTSTAAMTWIKLGHATSAEIEALANSLKPTDIMDVKYSDPSDASYTKMYCDGTANWVKLVAGMEKAAAFLETHRYANLVGGSMAFTKMEGTTVNAKDKVAYSALANIQTSMIGGQAAWSAAHQVTFPTTIKAGGILQHKLGEGAKDHLASAIDSAWVPLASHLMLRGEDIAADALGNTAHPDKVASPDNLKFSEKLRTLFIGEDSGNHVNNFLWAYNVDTQELSRILSTPAGAESTGLHAVDEINGWTYVMSNFQHAGDWSSLHGKIKDTLEPYINTNYNNGFSASVGYITAVGRSISLDKKST